MATRPGHGSRASAGACSAGADLRAGQAVRVTALDGLTLTVEADSERQTITGRQRMIFDFNLGLGTILVPILLLLLFGSLRILREYERGVVFLLGRFWKVKGPGLVIVIPGIQQMVRWTCAW
jgi:hypothetical protein